MSKNKKSKKKEFQNLLFENEYFEQQKLKEIPNAVEKYDQSDTNPLLEKSLAFKPSQIIEDEKLNQMTSLILKNQSQT
jgi:hypothetical protein